MIGLKKKNVLSVLFFLLFSAILAFTFWRRFQMSADRYFDPDEFMYLHWAYNIFSGKTIYVDFFSHVSPLYTGLLSLLFFFGKGIEPVLIARMLSVIVFGIFALSLSVLLWELNHSWTAIIGALIIAIIPIPSSKFIEVRPDTLAMALFIFGLSREIRWLKNKVDANLFWAGLLFSLSFLVMQKTVPLIVLASTLWLWIGLSARSDIKKGLMRYLLGLSLPWAFVLFWLGIRNASPVLYSILILPQEWFENLPYHDWPGFYFQPNGFYYGGYSYSFGYLANLIIWGAGIAWAAVRLLTSIFSRGYRSTVYLAMALMMFLQLALYIFYFRVNFMQYLIPVAAFIAIFIGDGLGLAWNKLAGKWGVTVGRPLVMLGLGYFCFLTFYRANPTYYLTNQSTFEMMKTIWAQVPKNEYIFDLEGSTLYFRDPYFVCCIPRLSDFDRTISRKLPPLKESLQKTQTKYIYQAYPYKLAGLHPEDQEFIDNNYQATGIGLLLKSTHW